MAQAANTINNSIGSSFSGGTNTLTITNPSNTASSNALKNITVGGTSAGDPFTTYTVSGTTNWSTGIDNSVANDPYVISASNALGTTNALSITTAGAATLTSTLATTGVILNGGSTLADYVTTSSWTPVLAFGGASVGITYTAQAGFYLRIGNLVSFTFLINLSNKGSSTGQATVTGLGLSTNNAFYSFPMNAQVITFVGNYISGLLLDNQNFNMTIQIITSAGAATDLTDVNFANNSILICSGSFLM